MGKIEMPESIIDSVLVLVFQIIASYFLDILIGPDISGINEYGYQKLNGDLTAMSLFCEKCRIDNLGIELKQPKQLCEFLTSGKVVLNNMLCLIYK